jgi:hypothetical protein
MIGNEGLFLIQWLQTHERAVIYGNGSIFIIGLCKSLPTAVKDGFIK